MTSLLVVSFGKALNGMPRSLCADKWPTNVERVPLSSLRPTARILEREVLPLFSDTLDDSSVIG